MNTGNQHQGAVFGIPVVYGKKHILCDLLINKTLTKNKIFFVNQLFLNRKQAH